MGGADVMVRWVAARFETFQGCETDEICLLVTLQHLFHRFFEPKLELCNRLRHEHHEKSANFRFAYQSPLNRSCSVPRGITKLINGMHMSSTQVQKPCSIRFSIVIAADRTELQAGIGVGTNSLHLSPKTLPLILGLWKECRVRGASDLGSFALGTVELRQVTGIAMLFMG